MKRLALTLEPNGLLGITNWTEQETPPYTDHSTPQLIQAIERLGLELNPVCPIAGPQRRLCG